MKNQKKYVARKLKKGHIWPAIFFCILFMASTFILCCVITSLFCLHTFQGKYEDGAKEAIRIEELMQRFCEQGDSVESSLIKIQDLGFPFESAFLINKDREVIDGIGDMTAFMHSDNKDYNENMVFYADKSEGVQILNEDQDIDLPYADILTTTMDFSTLEKDPEKWMQEPIAEFTCWIVVPTDTKDLNFIVKTPITLFRADLFYVTVAACLIMFFLSVPMVIMMINAIIAIANQRRMRLLLMYDEVTGGNNWIGFRENAGKFLYKNRKKEKYFAVVDFEIMKYRSYCTCHSAKEGEKLLENVYLTICNNLQKQEVCARYARANFAILLWVENEEDAKRRLTSIIDQAKSCILHERIIIHAGFYVGNTATQQEWLKVKKSEIDVDKYYNNAAAARANIPGNEDCFAAVFNDKLLEDQLWEHEVENTMDAALRSNEFAVYYQPKYNPVTHELVGAEALIRWIRSDGTIIPPGRFIPIFENNGFITQIDDYMITNVAKQQAQWLAEGKNVVPVSVNISRAHFAKADLAKHIKDLVDAYKTPHHLVEIELTESAFFDDKNVLLSTVKQLKDFGFEISMDDFGAGYSSLNSLKDLPLDVLKLDAEFFRGDVSDERGDIVVTEAISLAKQLHMRIVAEGIEKKEQVDFLANAGCDMIQGYYFAKPMPKNEYEERMAGKIA